MTEPVIIGAAIVGAQKCATTSLAAALGQHPGVCLARDKEAHLFDQRDVQENGPSAEQLDHAFAHRRPGQLLLDATPSYLYLPGCIEALLRHSPDVRVIVVVRNAAHRALSHHAHERRMGTESLPFPLAVVAERRRLRRDRDPLAPGSAHRCWSYLDRGRFEKQILSLSTVTDHVHLVFFEDLVRDPHRTLEGVVGHLGLAPLPTLQLPWLNAATERPRWWDRATARVATVSIRRRNASAIGRLRKSG